MITYLLQSSTCLIFLYGVYHLMLGEMTFFRYNRVYLLSAIAISLIIPLLAPYLTLTPEQVPVIHWSYVNDEMNVLLATTVNKDVTVDYFSWFVLVVILIYLTGVTIVLAKMGYGLWKIYKYYISGSKEQKKGFTIITTKNVHLPFSFFRYVFISSHVPLKNHIQTILDHEEIHIRHWHSIDVLFAELVHAFYWFNPVMIFYKRALSQAHEYLADAYVCQHSCVSSYTELLINKSKSGMELALTNQFFHSQIKKRIKMMHTKSSDKKTLWKYALLLPLVVAFVIVFSSSKTHMKLMDEELKSLRDSIPDNSDVESIHIRNEKAVVELKNGKSESYNLNIKTEKEAYEGKYGDLAKPPVPPTPPSSVKAPTPPAPPSATLPPSPPNAPNPPKGFKSGPNSKGYILSVADNHGECIVVVKDKNKKVIKAFDLVEWNKNEKANTLKYGEIPPPPPAPPSPPAAPLPSGVPPPPNAPVPPAAPIWNGQGSGEDVDEMPRFPGCEELTDENEKEVCSNSKLAGFISRTMKYPAEAKTKGIEGKCMVEFLIDEQGQMSEIHLKKDLGYGCGEEVLRVMNEMTKMNQNWIPARLKGKKVSMRYTLPVMFAL
ncbi:MAG: M56 family metallopeptidase [Saprospiraceae bacterium]